MCFIVEVWIGIDSLDVFNKFEIPHLLYTYTSHYFFNNFFQKEFIECWFEQNLNLNKILKVIKTKSMIYWVY